MTGARRLATYLMAFAGLHAVLYAASGLLALAVATPTLQSDTMIGATDIRNRASLHLATLIVALPLWLGGWRAAQRRTIRRSAERNARERRWFLAAVFATTSVVALFALHTVLRVLLALPGPAAAQPSGLEGIAAGTRLFIYGAAWLAYTLLGWQERDPRDADAAHDLAVYVLAGCALGFLVIGLYQALHRLIGDVVRTGQHAVVAEPAGALWTIWGAMAAWIVAGGLTWAAIWQYDMARRGRRPLRVLYLYVVLLAAIPTVLGSSTLGLSELLRRAFGYHTPAGNWDFVGEIGPPLLVGGALWAYHWLVLRQQAVLDATTRTSPIGAIPWPRRPAIALLMLLGLALTVPALISLVWLGLDALLNPTATLSGSDWWRDRVSRGSAAGLVGTGVWLGAWSMLQRAAATAPPAERSARERRLLLATITLVSALAALGFAVALLWLILRTLLGEALDASTVSRGLKDLSAVALLAGIAIYHGLILRADLRHAPTGPERMRVVALVAPGAEQMLSDLRQRSGLHIEVIGYLSPDQSSNHADVGALPTLLANLPAREHAQGDSALLILHPDHASLHPYVRAAARHHPAPGQSVRAVKAATDRTS